MADKPHCKISPTSEDKKFKYNIYSLTFLENSYLSTLVNNSQVNFTIEKCELGIVGRAWFWSMLVHVKWIMLLVHKNGT